MQDEAVELCIVGYQLGGLLELMSELLTELLTELPDKHDIMLVSHQWGRTGV